MLFTSESVFKGHPDKVADQISDAIVDVCIDQDSNSRVAVETLVTKNKVVLAGEITSNAVIDFDKIVRDTIAEIGYTDVGIGFSDKEVSIETYVQEQSSDIAMGVDVGGAGDNGMMFGGAVCGTQDLMPVPLAICRALQRKFYKELENDSEAKSWFRPDGKTQATVMFEKRHPMYLQGIVFNIQHVDIPIKTIRDWIRGVVIEPSVKHFHDVGVLEREQSQTLDPEIYINPTGKFVTGGPAGDTGVTGRKVVVDTYGGYFHHGGGAFSGKDASKVDRSAAYMARYIAKNVVAAGIMTECEVQIGYAIGIDTPVSIGMSGKSSRGRMVDIDTTHAYSILRDIFDCRPNSISKIFEMRKSASERGFRYQDLSAYGHVGEEIFRSIGSKPKWEQTDKVNELIDAFTTK